MMKLLKIVGLLSAFLIASASHGKAVTGDSVEDTDKVILTVSVEQIDYFPFNYTENAKIKGFSVDVLNYFEEHSKYEFEFVILPWPRALLLVAHGEVDLILTLFKNSKREPIYHFIEPSYANEVNQLFSLVENNYTFDGQLASLRPYSIGTKREYSYGQEFDDATYLKKLPVLTEDVLLKLLLSGRIDLMIGNPFNFNEIMLKQKVKDRVNAIKPYVAITPVYMALTKQREDAQEIKQTFERLTTELKATPYYQELLKKYQLDF